MALENLEPENRVERLLSGADLEPANRLEYFLKQAGSGGGEPSGAKYTLLQNPEPFYVEDLVNGGTRLFDPETDGISVMITVEGAATIINSTGPVLVTDEGAPYVMVETDADGNKYYDLITSWKTIIGQRPNIGPDMTGFTLRSDMPIDSIDGQLIAMHENDIVYARFGGV